MYVRNDLLTLRFFGSSIISKLEVDSPSESEATADPDTDPNAVKGCRSKPVSSLSAMLKKKNLFFFANIFF